MVLTRSSLLSVFHARSAGVSTRLRSAAIVAACSDGELATDRSCGSHRVHVQASSLESLTRKTNLRSEGECATAS